MKLRSLADKRIVEILAIFDAHSATPTRKDNPSMLCSFMHILDITIYERFEIPGGWSDEGIRAVLLAFVVNCPNADLKETLALARKELKWLRRFETEHAYEARIVDGNCIGKSTAQMRVELAALDKAAA